MKKLQWMIVIGEVILSLAVACVPTRPIPTNTPEPSATSTCVTTMTTTPGVSKIPTPTLRHPVSTALPPTPEQLRRLLPGVTIESQVLALLGEPNETEVKDTIFGTYKEWKYLASGVELATNEVVFRQDGVVLYVDILLTVDEQYTFRSLVERYGRPDLIKGVYESGDPSATHLEVWAFVYAEKGLEVGGADFDPTPISRILDHMAGSELRFPPMSRQEYLASFGQNWFERWGEQEVDPSRVFGP